MTKIFLSYSKHNYDVASILAHRLEEDGFSVWWDHELVAGSEYDTTIESQLQSAEKVIVLWSKASVSSRWVRSEADHAAQKGRLVPVLIEQVEVPIAFRLIHFVPMFDLGRGVLSGHEYAKLLRTVQMDDDAAELPVAPQTNLRKPGKGSKDDVQSIGFAILVLGIVTVAFGLLVNVWLQIL